MAMVDKRRQDRRSAVHTQNPFWIKSDVIDYSTAGAGEVVAFSFPFGASPEAKTFMVLGAVVKVEETFDGSASMIVGEGTIPNDTDKAGAVVTAVDADYYHISTDITEATLGYYPAVGSQFATDLGIGKAHLITGADTTTPVVYATLTATGATKGKARILLLVSRVD